PALFAMQPSISPTGTLTYQAAQFANGTAHITVALHDDAGTAHGGVDTSSSITFTINILPVNQPPSFTPPGTDQTITADTGPNLVTYTVPGWATNISPGPANQASQTLTFLVSNDNNGLFAGQPAIAPDGTLTYTPAAFANGTANVTVVLQSSGSTANGGSN